MVTYEILFWIHSYSVGFFSNWDLFLFPSLLICNKLSNEGSAIFVAQVLLLELLKNCQKSWRTFVRTDISSTFRRFEQMSVRTIVLDPYEIGLHEIYFWSNIFWPNLVAHRVRQTVRPRKKSKMDISLGVRTFVRRDICSNRRKVELMSVRTNVLFWQFFKKFWKKQLAHRNGRPLILKLIANQ